MRDGDVRTLETILYDPDSRPEPDYRHVLEHFSDGNLFEEWRADEPPPASTDGSQPTTDSDDSGDSAGGENHVAG
jgi:hypothetical protein